jgi:hypothetical protein
MPARSEPQSALIAAGSSGFTTLVAAVTGRAIKVHSYNFSAGGTVSYRFFSGTVTGLTGTFLGAANGYYASGHSPGGHFETAAGAALTGSLSANQNIQGCLVYTLEG